MWAAIRLVRATRVFAIIFLSYLWQMSWARLWPTRYDDARALEEDPSPQRAPHVQRASSGCAASTSSSARSCRSWARSCRASTPRSSRRCRTTCRRSRTRRSRRRSSRRSARRRRGVRDVRAASRSRRRRSARSTRRATTPGDRLAVKILYPNVATIIKVDLRVLGWALRVYKNFVPVQQIERVHEQLADMLARETDLVNEARCIDAHGEELRRRSRRAVPDGLSASGAAATVMTMTFMDGVKITKKDALDDARARPVRRRDEADQGVLQAAVHRSVLPRRSAPRELLRAARARRPGRASSCSTSARRPSCATNLADGMFDILQGLMTRKDDLVVKGIDDDGLHRADRRSRAARAHRRASTSRSCSTSTSPTSARSIRRSRSSSPIPT